MSIWMRALKVLTHVAGQLCWRWLPPPVVPLDADFAAPPAALCQALETRWPWREPELAALLRWAQPKAGDEEREPLLPWWDRFAQRFDPGEGTLAKNAARHLGMAHAARAHLLVHGDAAYPVALAAIPEPPLAMTYTGARDLWAALAVAVVGSRQASAHALRSSFELGRSLAAAGHAVVSGGAFGCDIAAHRGALMCERTPVPAICVLAGGLDRPYPLANGATFAALASRRGVLVSERLWWAPAMRHDFPARNRIIAGLARVTFVMQAAERSGALVTARLAADYGRDVLVLPHPPHDVRAEGGAALLRDGARPLDITVAGAASLG